MSNASVTSFRVPAEGQLERAKDAFGVLGSILTSCIQNPEPDVVDADSCGHNVCVAAIQSALDGSTSSPTPTSPTTPLPAAATHDSTSNLVIPTSAWFGPDGADALLRGCPRSLAVLQAAVHFSPRPWDTVASIMEHADAVVGVSASDSAKEAAELALLVATSSAVHSDIRPSPISMLKILKTASSTSAAGEANILTAAFAGGSDSHAQSTRGTADDRIEDSGSSGSATASGLTTHAVSWEARTIVKLASLAAAGDRSVGANQRTDDRGSATRHRLGSGASDASSFEALRRNAVVRGSRSGSSSSLLPVRATGKPARPKRRNSGTLPQEHADGTKPGIVALASLVPPGAETNGASRSADDAAEVEGMVLRATRDEANSLSTESFAESERHRMSFGDLDRARNSFGEQARLSRSFAEHTSLGGDTVLEEEEADAEAEADSGAGGIEGDEGHRRVVPAIGAPASTHLDTAHGDTGSAFGSTTLQIRARPQHVRSADNGADISSMRPDTHIAGHSGLREPSGRHDGLMDLAAAGGGAIGAELVTGPGGMVLFVRATVAPLAVPHLAVPSSSGDTEVSDSPRASPYHVSESGMARAVSDGESQMSETVVALHRSFIAKQIREQVTSLHRFVESASGVLSAKLKRALIIIGYKPVTDTVGAKCTTWCLDQVEAALPAAGRAARSRLGRGYKSMQRAMECCPALELAWLRVGGFVHHMPQSPWSFLSGRTISWLHKRQEAESASPSTTSASASASPPRCETHRSGVVFACPSTRVFGLLISSVTASGVLEIQGSRPTAGDDDDDSQTAITSQLQSVSKQSMDFMLQACAAAHKAHLLHTAILEPDGIVYPETAARRYHIPTWTKLDNHLPVPTHASVSGPLALLRSASMGDERIIEFDKENDDELKPFPTSVPQRQISDASGCTIKAPLESFSDVFFGASSSTEWYMSKDSLSALGINQSASSIISPSPPSSPRGPMRLPRSRSARLTSWATDTSSVDDAVNNAIGVGRGISQQSQDTALAHTGESGQAMASFGIDASPSTPADASDTAPQSSPAAQASLAGFRFSSKLHSDAADGQSGVPSTPTLGLPKGLSDDWLQTGLDDRFGVFGGTSVVRPIDERQSDVWLSGVGGLDMDDDDVQETRPDTHSALLARQITDQVLSADALQAHALVDSSSATSTSDPPSSLLASSDGLTATAVPFHPDSTQQQSHLTPRSSDGQRSGGLSPLPELPVDPRATSVDPRATSVDPRATSVDPRATSVDPRATSAPLARRSTAELLGFANGAAQTSTATAGAYGERGASSDSGADSALLAVESADDKPRSKREPLMTVEGVGAKFPAFLRARRQFLLEACRRIVESGGTMLMSRIGEVLRHGLSQPQREAIEKGTRAAKVWKAKLKWLLGTDYFGFDGHNCFLLSRRDAEDAIRARARVILNMIGTPVTVEAMGAILSEELPGNIVPQQNLVRILTAKRGAGDLRCSRDAAGNLILSAPRLLPSETDMTASKGVSREVVRAVLGTEPPQARPQASLAESASHPMDSMASRQSGSAPQASATVPHSRSIPPPQAQSTPLPFQPPPSPPQQPQQPMPLPQQQHRIEPSAAATMYRRSAYEYLVHVTHLAASRTGPGAIMVDMAQMHSARPKEFNHALFSSLPLPPADLLAAESSTFEVYGRRDGITIRLRPEIDTVIRNTIATAAAPTEEALATAPAPASSSSSAVGVAGVVGGGAAAGASPLGFASSSAAESVAPVASDTAAVGSSHAHPFEGTVARRMLLSASPSPQVALAVTFAATGGVIPSFAGLEQAAAVCAIVRQLVDRSAAGGSGMRPLEEVARRLALPGSLDGQHARTAPHAAGGRGGSSGTVSPLENCRAVVGMALAAGSGILQLSSGMDSGAEKTHISLVSDALRVLTPRVTGTCLVHLAMQQHAESGSDTGEPTKISAIAIAAVADMASKLLGPTILTQLSGSAEVLRQPQAMERACIRPLLAVTGSHLEVRRVDSAADSKAAICLDSQLRVLLAECATSASDLINSVGAGESARSACTSRVASSVRDQLRALEHSGKTGLDKASMVRLLQMNIASDSLKRAQLFSASVTKTASLEGTADFAHDLVSMAIHLSHELGDPARTTAQMSSSILETVLFACPELTIERDRVTRRAPQRGAIPTSRQSSDAAVKLPTPMQRSASFEGPERRSAWLMQLADMPTDAAAAASSSTGVSRESVSFAQVHDDDDDVADEALSPLKRDNGRVLGGGYLPGRRETSTNQYALAAASSYDSMNSDGHWSDPLASVGDIALRQVTGGGSLSHESLAVPFMPSETLRWGALLNLPERHDRELKQLRRDGGFEWDAWVRKQLPKYASAFLNTRGGMLYFGVSDDRTVCTMAFTEKLMDQFICLVDYTLRTRMKPPVPGHMYDVQFIPVAPPESPEEIDAAMSVTRLSRSRLMNEATMRQYHVVTVRFFAQDLFQMTGFTGLIPSYPISGRVTPATPDGDLFSTMFVRQQASAHALRSPAAVSQWYESRMVEMRATTMRFLLNVLDDKSSGNVAPATETPPRTSASDELSTEDGTASVARDGMVSLSREDIASLCRDAATHAIEAVTGSLGSLVQSAVGEAVARTTPADSSWHHTAPRPRQVRRSDEAPAPSPQTQHPGPGTGTGRGAGAGGMTRGRGMGQRHLYAASHTRHPTLPSPSLARHHDHVQESHSHRHSSPQHPMSVIPTSTSTGVAQGPSSTSNWTHPHASAQPDSRGSHHSTW